MNIAERDKKAYKLAHKFLLGLDGVTPEMVERHLSSPGRGRRTVYQQLLESAQSANMKTGVIGGAIGGVDRLKGVLCNFDPKRVLAKFQNDPERVLDTIVAEVKPRGEVRRTKRSIWPKFCVTILSGAAFLSQFKDRQEFDRWVRTFDDPRSRAALPLLLSEEIEGIGFALACDFLKQLGHQDYCKPDIHLKKIFVALGLSTSDQDYTVFKAVTRMAVNVGKTPYHVDKLFWLIGSGRFDQDNVGIGNHRDEFIEHARKVLGLAETQ